MPSSETGSKRRSIPHQSRQAVLRSHLFSLYRKDHRYQTLVANELRPLWQTFERDMRAQFGDGIAFHSLFDQLLAAIEGRPNSLLAPIDLPMVDGTGRLIPPPSPPAQEQLDMLGLYVETVQH